MIKVYIPKKGIGGKGFKQIIMHGGDGLHHEALLVTYEEGHLDPGEEQQAEVMGSGGGVRSGKGFQHTNRQMSWVLVVK